MNTTFIQNLIKFALILIISMVVDESNAQTTPKKESKPAKSATTKADDKTDDKVEPFVVKVAKNKIHFTVTGTWKKTALSNDFVEYEIKIPKVESDKQDGRLTISGAMGGIEANIDRWIGQYSQPDGSSTEDKTKTKEVTINGQKVHFVSIEGTLADSSGGMFSGKPKVKRKNYRMFAAIIETENHGLYFVKFYGPKATVDKNEKHFKSMIESVKVVD